MIGACCGTQKKEEIEEKSGRTTGAGCSDRSNDTSNTTSKEVRSKNICSDKKVYLLSAWNACSACMNVRVVLEYENACSNETSEFKNDE